MFIAENLKGKRPDMLAATVDIVMFYSGVLFACLLALFCILAFSSSSVTHFARVTVLYTGSNVPVSRASPS